MKYFPFAIYRLAQRHQEPTEIENKITKMSTLTPPEDQPARARSKSITLNQPQTATHLLGGNGNNTLQVSSSPRSKSMLELSTPQQETTTENNTTNPHSLIVMQLKSKHGDKDGRTDSQESLNRPGS